MSGLVIKKSLIGEQDLLLGRETQDQERAGAIYKINGMTFIKPVENIEELKNLDPKKYDTAFIRGNDVIEENPAGEGVLVAGNNEFYYFDLLSEEAEDIPNIIKSNVTEIGRWKLAKVGQQRITAEVTKEVADATQNVVDDVMQQVETLLQTEIPEAVADGLVEVDRNGGQYRPDIEYSKGNYVKAFQKVGIGVQEKTFLVKSDSPITQTPPLSTASSETFGEVTIFAENATIDEANYQEIIAPKLTTKSFAVTADKNYRIFTGGVIPRGRMKVTFFKNASITGSMTISWSGSALNDFSFSEVMYSKVLRQNAVISSLGYIFYTGFAIYATPTDFGFAVKSTGQCDRIELDYSDMNIVPNFNPTGVTFDSNNCYAPRQGGGSYIPNIGSTFFSMKKSGGATTGDSDEFYNFMSGSIPWTNGITLDANLYHQYHSACVLPTMDNSGRIAKNLMLGKNVGDLQDESLPNIKGEFGYDNFSKSTNINNYNTYLDIAQNDFDTSYPLKKIGYSGAVSSKLVRNNSFGSLSGKTFYYDNSLIAKSVDTSLYSVKKYIDASLSSSIYQDGAEVNQKAVYKQERLQVF